MEVPLIKRPAFRYSTKIWLLSVIASPFVYWLMQHFFSTSAGMPLAETLTFLFLALVYGMVLSLLNYLLLIVISQDIFRKTHNALKRRILMQLVVTALWYCLFAIITETFDPRRFMGGVATAYLITLSAGVWLFRAGDKVGEHEIIFDEIFGEEEEGN